MQISPRENFTIVRQISDHTDSATYYVQAVIRNAKTDVLLDTVNLTDKGNRRFSKSWLVPADVSGQGFWISILTTIYTDSGYTTKSPTYGEEMETYLVQDRFNMNLGGMGGGSDIDYKRIKKIIDESLGTIEKPEGVELGGITSDVKSAIKAIRETENVLGKKIEAIKMPKCDHKEMMKAIDNIEMPIMPEMPKMPEFDYSIITSAVEEANNNLLSSIQKLSSLTITQKEEIASLITGTMEKNTASFQKIEQMKKLLAGDGNDMTSTKPKMEFDPRISKLMNKLA